MPQAHLESQRFISGVIITGFSLMLAVSFEYLLYGKTLGIGFPLFILLVLGVGFIVTKKRRCDPELLWALLPLLFFSWMVFVRANHLLTLLNILASVILLLLLIDLQTGKKVRNFVLRQYAEVLVLPTKFLNPLGNTLSDVASLRGVHRHSAVVSQIMKGIFMAIPVLILFIALFSSADLLFQKYVFSILTFSVPESVAWLFVRIIVASCIFIGAFSYLLYGPDASASTDAQKKPFSVSLISLSIFLGAINILFLLFILIQLVYLFGGNDNITVEGFTYAEYARKGFFELIIVAVFSFLILWSAERSVDKKENAQHGVVFKVQNSILVAELLVIMFSAFTRLSLYESAYGFTTLRLYSHAFIILLCVVFLILLTKILWGMKEHAFAFGMFLSVTLFLIVMNLLNPDAFIARQNIARFSSDSEKLDIPYLTRLSADAFPETIDYVWAGTNWPYATMAYDEENFGVWQSTNLSRLRAIQLVKSKQN